MENYQKMYTLLFNAITDAIDQIEQRNYGSAKDLLILAQQKAEACYIEEDAQSLPVASSDCHGF